MQQTPTILERAFELAKSGRVGDTAELRRQLKAEGFVEVDAHLRSRALSKQLLDLIRASHRTGPARSGQAS